VKKSDYCIKIIEIMGMRTATIQKVESVKKGAIRLVDSRLTFDADSYEELDPMIPGCRSYLVEFDDGEVENWDLKEQG